MGTRVDGDGDGSGWWMVDGGWWVALLSGIGAKKPCRACLANPPLPKKTALDRIKLLGAKEARNQLDTSSAPGAIIIEESTAVWSECAAQSEGRRPSLPWCTGALLATLVP